MVRIDDAEIIRQLAYEIWEREGRPSGREHEHWAEANRTYSEMLPRVAVVAVEETVWNRGEAEQLEIAAMRAALWTPETYSSELFGQPNVAAPKRRSAMPSGAPVGSGRRPNR